MSEPKWPNLYYPKIDFQDAYYYAAPKSDADKPKSLDEIDPEILSTYNKLGIPIKEQEMLAGIVGSGNVAVDAVFDSVSVATTFKSKLSELGIIFCPISEAVKKHPDLVSCVGFVRRYDESYMDAKKTIEKNKIGDPFFVRSQTVDKDTWAPFQVDYVKSGGGIFHDFNVHDADLARWFIGSEVKKVWSLGGAFRFKEFGDLNDADNTFAFCEFENGKMALLGASRTSSYGHDTFTEIIGTLGKLTVGNPPFKNRLQISDKNGYRYECNETFYDRFKDAFLTQIHDFINSILNKKQNQCTLSNARKATMITTAMTESFKTKKIVELKDLE